MSRECKDCGCNRLLVIGRSLFCDHCGADAGPLPESAPAADDLPHRTAAGVPFHVMLCPQCRSDRVKVTSTRRPVRHHKCGNCGHAFKSVEKQTTLQDL